MGILVLVYEFLYIRVISRGFQYNIFIAYSRNMEKPNARKNQQARRDSRNDKAYIEAVKEFLTTFKTQQCQNKSEHDAAFCNNHHIVDKRRNPYHRNSFAYFPDLQSLHDSKGNDVNSQQMLCENQTQLYYHPILYKTQKCHNFYHCLHGLYCPNIHLEDQQAFEYGQFFRFNIDTHKTKPCPKRQHHERKTCIYYHNGLDRRRPNFNNYSHELCTKYHCKDENCHYSHNKIQQVYHPTRYKTKFCKTYTNQSLKCDYKQFCGFAHVQSEIKVQMIHLLARDQEFFFRKFKTVWCPDTLQHDRSSCVYAHNIQDFRRDPFASPNYEPQKCPNWNFDEQLKSIEDSGCKEGMNCTKCHGWMEQRYHPQVYKKSKFAENKQVSSILDKKLNNTQKQTTIKEKSVQPPGRISSVVEDKIIEQQTKAIASNVHNGAPFFKKQATSESSRRSKALTTNIESDDSCNRDEQPRVAFINTSQKTARSHKKNMFLFSQDAIWDHEDDNNQFQKKLNEERARSQNKFDECETVYSHSLKQTIGNSSLLKKLKNNNINGPKIKNLTEQEIEQFKFLNNKQKQILYNKVRLYHLRREKNPIIYSLELAKFFITRKKEHLLQKTKAKKIKEQELMNIKRKNISKLDFLSAEELDELLELIEDFKKFCNEKEFRLINAEIARFVSPKHNNRKPG